MAITHSNKSITGKHFRKRMRKNAQKAVEFKTVRYIISGGTATFIDIASYYICIHYILHERNLELGFFTLSFPIASLVFSYSCGFIASFTLSKLFVFTGSDVRTRHQLIRFTGVAIGSFFLNYVLMKGMIFAFGIFPTVSRIIAAAVVAVTNYIIHNAFTFKVKGVNTRKNP